MTFIRQVMTFGFNNFPLGVVYETKWPLIKFETISPLLTGTTMPMLPVTVLLRMVQGGGSIDVVQVKICWNIFAGIFQQTWTRRTLQNLKSRGWNVEMSTIMGSSGQLGKIALQAGFKHFQKSQNNFATKKAFVKTEIWIKPYQEAQLSSSSKSNKNIKRLQKKLDKERRQGIDCKKLFVCHENTCTT